MKRSLLAIFAIAGLMSLQAQAGLLIEPVVGYTVGQNLDFEHGSSYNGGTGPSYGGRIGGQSFGLQVGLDLLKSNINMNDSDFKSNLNLTEWAGFIGFEFPLLFRIYGGYIFKADGTIDDSTGKESRLEDGRGVKAGLGLTFLPLIDINLEYRKGTFGTTHKTGMNSSDDTNYHAYMLALSLPLNI